MRVVLNRLPRVRRIALCVPKAPGGLCCISLYSRGAFKVSIPGMLLGLALEQSSVRSDGEAVLDDSHAPPSEYDS
jgi:hypothetical protein